MNRRIALISTKQRDLMSDNEQINSSSTKRSDLMSFSK